MQLLTVGLVGNPNCGKTTLFNALTGSHQRVGNWSGVTVERKTGHYTHNHRQVAVVDLPGVYSLVSNDSTAAIDERIASHYIASAQADIIINIVDAANLERNLYLTIQLLEMQLPVIVAVNMMDAAAAQGITVNIETLRQRLGCPVVAIQANRKKGIDDLRAIIEAVPKNNFHLPYPASIERSIAVLSPLMSKTISAMPVRWLAIRCLENDVTVARQVSCAEDIACCQQSVTAELDEDCDIVIADSRYAFITRVLKEAVKKHEKSRSWTQVIDRWVLHRFWGVPVFFAVMYAMFFFAINIGGAFQDFFDKGSDALLVNGLSQVMTGWGFSSGVISIALGIGKGINTTVTFIPVLACMFLFLSLLENSGYMMRAAFVVDRFMRTMGLPGKSFVPLIVGFGCNVPAIMGARTLENKRDRILTVVMAPFMSCGARLAIYAVFIAVFFPSGGAAIVFALYLIGILMAVLTGLLLRKTVLLGESSPLVMELPPYHWPVMRMIMLHVWQRLKGFLWRAGRFIVPICVVVTVLNAVTLRGEWMTEQSTSPSVLAVIGKSMTPVLAPMGIRQENWPATVGLITGMLAKEVVIGTLNTLYVQENISGAPSLSVSSELLAAVNSIPANFAALSSSWQNPIAASSSGGELPPRVMGQMARHFDGQIGAFAYLLFILLYIPCVSAIAAIRRELSRNWALFSIGWNTLTAYGVAVSFYQVATVFRHPAQSIIWLVMLSGLFLVALAALRVKGLRQRAFGLV